MRAISSRVRLFTVLIAVSVVVFVAQGASATAGLFGSATSISALGASSRSISVPAGTTAGDVLIAQVVLNQNNISGVTAPSGWTLACSQGGTSVAQGIWWHAAGASEPASYTWQLPSNSGVIGNMLRYSGINTTSPVDTCSGQSSTSPGTTMTAPALTTTGGDQVIMTAFGFTNAGYTTPATGYTERTDAKTSKDPLGRAVSSETADKPSGSCNSGACSIAEATATAAMLSGQGTPNWVALQYGLSPSVPPAPYNMAPAVVSGRTQEGAMLTTTNGAWNGSGINYGYQWQRCNPVCSDISGATNASYTLTSSDLGKTVQSVVTATNGGGSATTTSAATQTIGYFFDDFTGTDSIITNEYADSHPNAPGIYTSPDWEMTSGCLYRLGNAGWTGVPDTATSSSIACSPNNNSNIFRLNTKAAFSGNIAVQLDLKQNTDIHSSTCAASGTCYYGTHVWMRHQNQYDLYYASVNRADGKMVLKRKVPCGPSNSGTYIVLGSGYVAHDWSVNTFNRYKVTVTDNTNGSVALAIYDLANPSTPVVTATDSGGTNPNWSAACTTPGRYSSASYPPLTGFGKVGVRGDFADFSIDNFSVLPN